MIKNKFKLYMMGIVSAVIATFAGFGLAVGGSIVGENKTNQVYDEITQTPAYTEYYNKKTEEYLQEYKNGDITLKQFDTYMKEIGIDGYIKQLSGKEKAELDERLKPIEKQSKTLMYSGLPLCISGSFFMIGITLYQVNRTSTYIINKLKSKKKEDEDYFIDM